MLGAKSVDSINFFYHDLSCLHLLHLRKKGFAINLFPAHSLILETRPGFLCCLPMPGVSNMKGIQRYS